MGKLFWNFISTVIILVIILYYIGKTSNRSENLYRTYKLLTENMYILHTEVVVPEVASVIVWSDIINAIYNFIKCSGLLNNRINFLFNVLIKVVQPLNATIDKISLLLIYLKIGFIQWTFIHLIAFNS